MLEVRLLGRFEIRHGSKAVSIESRAAQSLFAFLGLNAGTAYRREKLAGQLWPDSTEEAARDYLRHALWRIRKALQHVSASPCLQANDLTVSFDASSQYWLDTAALQEANEAGPIDRLAAALSAYAGELLPGFEDEWVVLERERLQAVYERKVGRLSEMLTEAERNPEVLEWAEKWIALGHKPESAFRYLMSAYAAQGDMAKAAAAYERCVKSLAEYGMEPSEQTRGLYEQIKAGKTPAQTPPKPIQPRQAARAYSNLPNPLTSFIGRRQEMDAIVRLIDRKKVVTVTGPGGVGKTRLAVQVANKIRSKFKDGICWTELAPLADPDLVPQAIANSLGVRELPGQSLTAALAHYLTSKQLLLILDNCEHLILACAQIVESLATACPKLRILATSREPLGILGEMVYDVPALSMPEPQRPKSPNLLMEYESIRLFVERAQAVRPNFQLTAQNADAVDQICRQLDGMPLALELAAARTRLLSAEHIAARLNDRFSLLTQGSRTALPRHQTLRAAIDWSYDQLPEEARVLFQRLSIFAGGFTIEAAEAICSESPLSPQAAVDLLGRLKDRSLVIVHHQENSQRYQMLETIRGYSYEKLKASGELEELRRHHPDFFVALVEKAGPGLKAAEQVYWLDRLEDDQDNIRAAWLACFARSELQAAARLVSALFHYWLRRGNPSEGRTWTNRILERPENGLQAGQRAYIFGIAGFLAFIQNDLLAAGPLLEQGLALGRMAGNQEATAWALQWLGRLMNLGGGDPKAFEVLMEEALEIYQDLEDRWGIASVLFNLSVLARSAGRYEEARARARESLAIFQALGDALMVGAVLGGLADIAQLQESFEEAEEYCEQCLRSARATGGGYMIASALHVLAWIRLRRGHASVAAPLFEECLRLGNESGNMLIVVSALAGIAGVLVVKENVRESAQLLGAANTLLVAMEAVLGENMTRDALYVLYRKRIDYYLELVRQQLEDPPVAEAWREGQSMGLEQAIAFAQAQLL